MYPRTLHAVLNFAAWQTRLLQNGYLRGYVLVIVLFTVGLVGLTFFLRVGTFTMPAVSWPRFYDLVLIAVILTATFLALRSRSRLATIALLGSVGFSIAVIFLLYSAPDLAMVQFAIETLTVILFVLVLYRLPKFSRLSSRLVRLVDGIVAVFSGAMMTLLMLLVSTHNSSLSLSRFFAENSASAANGRNIVNVILVDFRGFDTLGEITVLSIAAMGVVSLMQLTLQRPRRRRVIPKGEKS
jgi:multicomponent Na+:H+ antiporter subunit A